jgi:putative ABC transport system permease protein
MRLSKGTNPAVALSSVERAWKETFPDRSFDYFFLDEYYDRQFKSEMRFHTVFKFFALTAVFIVGLGVLGMSVFEANARIREISIRKVLGASVAGIVVLLSRNNFRLVMISAFIGGTTLWILADRWLSAYPLRVEFSALFVVVPLAVLLLIVVTISVTQALKAALSNPVNHLRNE